MELLEGELAIEVKGQLQLLWSPAAADHNRLFPKLVTVGREASPSAHLFSMGRIATLHFPVPPPAVAALEARFITFHQFVQRRSGDQAAVAGATQRAEQVRARRLRLEISHESVCHHVRRPVHTGQRLSCSTASPTKRRILPRNVMHQVSLSLCQPDKLLSIFPLPSRTR